MKRHKQQSAYRAKRHDGLAALFEGSIKSSMSIWTLLRTLICNSTPVFDTADTGLRCDMRKVF